MAFFISHTKLIQLSGHLSDSAKSLKLASEGLRQYKSKIESLQEVNKKLRLENRDLLRRIKKANNAKQ